MNLLTKEQIFRDNPHFNKKLSRRNFEPYRNNRFPEYTWVQHVFARNGFAASYLFDSRVSAWVLGVN